MEKYSVKTDINVETAKAVENVKKLEKELEKLTSAAEQDTEAIAKLEEQLIKARRSTTAAGQVLDKFGGTLEELGGEGVQPLSFAIGELEDRLYEMAAAGKQGTAEFEEMAAEVGRMKQTIMEVDMEVDAMSMTMTQKLGGSLQGAASGFELVQGVMGAMGVESEEVEKALLKVQSAMAIAQGVQGFKESLPAIKAFGSTAINAFKGMTTASKAFAATGIGLIVTLIAGAVSLFGSFAKSTEEITQENKKMTASFDKNTEAITKERDALKRSLDTRIEFASASGKSEKEIAEIRKKGLEDLISNNEKEIANTKKKMELLESEEYQRKIGSQVSSKEQFIELDNIRKKELASTKKILGELKSENNKARLDIKLDSIKIKKAEQEELDAKNEEEAAKRKEANKQYASERKAFIDQLKQIEQEYKDSFLTEQEREIAVTQRKYDMLFSQAKKYKVDTTELEKAMLNEINEINTKYAQEQLAIEQAKQDEINRVIKEANEQRLQDEEDFANQYQEAVNSDTQNEINAINDRYFYLIETAKQYGLDVSELERKQKEELSAINDKYREEEKAKDKELQEARYEAVKGGLDAIGSLAEAFAGESVESQKRAFKIQKAANIASATVDTYKAAQSAFASAPNPILGAVFAAIAVAAGIANIKKITSTKFEGGTSASSETPSAGGLGGIITPEFNIVGNSPVNQLAELQGQPVQAYVVSGEVTTAQALDRNRIANATL